jgi:hypothetical protein
MSRRHFDSTENAELREKIDRAKLLLPLPALMRLLGYHEKHIRRTALCPFHSDEHPSFSVFKGKDRFWHYKCFVCDSSGGDEIAFLVKHFNISRKEAIRRYLDMGGFPAGVPSKSREYPKSPDCPDSRESLNVLVSESPCVSVSHVSSGQTAAVQGVGGKLNIELRAVAARNACTGRTRPEKNSWQLARDLKAVAKRTGRKLHVTELMLAFYEWHRLSQPFLDADKAFDHYWIGLLAQLQKARVPTGEGTINDALQNVSTLTEADLPVVPGYGNALAPRKIAALHRELARRSKKKDKGYFLSYRDAAKVCEQLSHQEAHTITFALATVGVIEIVKNGKAGLNSREAAEFRYLLSEPESAEEDDDEIPV